MVGALMKSQKEIDQAKSSSNKLVSASSRKKEAKNLKKLGKKIGSLFPKLEPQQQQGQRFTPLNASRIGVFMEIKRDPAFRWPSKMKGPPEKCNQ